jgi:sec-independent protein translocase protein TatB
MTPMLLDIGAGELLVLIVLAVLLFGPERVPELARKAARVIRFVRSVANSATDQIRTELGPEYSDFTLSDLTPKNLAKYVLPPEVQQEMDALRADLAGMRSEVDDLRKQGASAIGDGRRELDAGLTAATSPVAGSSAAGPTAKTDSAPVTASTPAGDANGVSAGGAPAVDGPATADGVVVAAAGDDTATGPDVVGTEDNRVSFDAAFAAAMAHGSQ